MVTIQISDALAERLEARGITNLETFIEKLIDKLDDIALENLVDLPPGSLVGKEDQSARIEALQRGFAEMRSGLTADELTELVNAINNEYIETEENA